MNKNNICKFIADTTFDKFETHAFIYESNPEAMKIPRKLQYHYAILVKSGSGEFKFDEYSVSFVAGSLVFGFEGEVFSVVFDEPCEYMYISFGGTRSETLFRRFEISKLNRCFSGFDGIVPMWHDSLMKATEKNIDLASESMILYTFSRIVNTNKHRSTLIEQILEITEEQFTNSELSINTISKELSYNPNYISHIFKQKMGRSYSEYLRTLRIKYAISLFEQGIDSIKNVAFLSGFSDSLYFSTVFKKTVGLSPKKYTELHK